MLTILTGALAGAFHVITGPDHLAAVAPLATLDRRRGWLAGWTWGLGHASGVMVVALAAAVLRDLLPPIDVLSAWSERVVGGALIALGLWGLRQSMRIRSTAHGHGPMTHAHLHVQAGPAWFKRLGHVHASFCMGILHGVAGSSHFLGVLPALALPSREQTLLYIAAFGAGTVVAMTAFAAAVGVTSARAGHGRGTPRLLLRVTATAAIAVGGYWLVG